MSIFGDNEFVLNVRKGLVAGHRVVDIFGVNPDVDSSADENIWDAGGIMVYPTAGEQWEIVFSSANDTSAGTGAREVTVFYLDDNYVEQIEVNASNGGTVTMTATDSFRFLRAAVTDAGTSVPKQNDGDITIQVAGGGSARGLIPQNKNSTSHGFYTIPAGKKGFIIDAYASVGKDDDVIVTLQTSFGDNQIFTGRLPIGVYQSLSRVVPQYFGPLTEKSEINAIVASMKNNVTCSAYLTLLLVDT